jgi:hypothetical protein
MCILCFSFYCFLGFEGRGTWKVISMNWNLTFTQVLDQPILHVLLMWVIQLWHHLERKEIYRACLNVLECGALILFLNFPV